MHGGLSPSLFTFDQLRRMTLPFEVPDEGGLIADLLWSDPVPGITGTRKFRFCTSIIDFVRETYLS